jgi:F-type H+-transporting ATPase subunit a
MAAESHAAPSAGDYIVHHLTHLSNAEAKSLIDFSVVHWDSVFFSVTLGALGCLVMWLVARKITSGVPGRLQAAVEFLVEMVENQAKGIVHNAHSRRLVAPMALTVFIWIILLNTMDLLPVDLLPLIWKGLYAVAGHDTEHAYLRVVPTADISVTMGLSVAVLLACLIYNIKIKGLGGWSHELIVAPFGTVKLTANPLSWVFFLLLAVANFAMQLLEFVSKTVSHGMRLYGNMYAGELIFLLIALLGGAFTLSLSGLGLALAHIIAGTGWAIFHILIIVLQAYVFMMLTLVYIGQAHDAH